MTARFLHQDGDGLLMEVDVDTYGVSAVLKAAHKFTDRCFIHLQQRTDKRIEVRFRSRSDSEGLPAIAGEFCNEILDQRLREVVSKESEPIRNLIMAHALSRLELGNIDKKDSHSGT